MAFDGNARVFGIHHVTAIAGDARENLRFYTQVLGMRLVKKSVNQDSPGTYHLFFADSVGTPGTDLTFFPWPEMRPARRGAGQVVEVPMAIPPSSSDYWRARLNEHGVKVLGEEERFGESVILFKDPHGLSLSLVATEGERPFEAWDQSPVPAENQIRGMHSVRSLVRDLEPTKELLTERMGFSYLGEGDGWHRFAADGDAPGQYIDVKVDPDAPLGAWGVGGVHHVAWRVPDDEAELQVREQVSAGGMGPTPPIDRFWFKSVYFKEPGGVLFELATDGPGFDRDESMDALGDKLILPPWLEPKRAAIEAALPDLS